MQQDNKVSRRVLELVRLNGPVIPTQISSEIGVSSLIASAVLSELVSNKVLKISSVKVGGTPLYYAPGQEEKLQNYTKYLHEKEVKAYDILKSELIMRDSLLDPVVRVALRNIKDFAVPVSVSDSGNKELFWKWYLLPDVKAEQIIKGRLQKKEERQAEKPDVPKEKTGTDVPEPKPQSGVSGQKTLPDSPRRKTPEKTVGTGTFAKKVEDYFSRNRIEIVQKIENKKRSEEEFIVSVPSHVGTIKYYAKAKDKKTCNEGDLSTAFVQGQNRNMPVLFLTPGKITKKAGDMLKKEFSGMTLKQL